MTDRDFKMPDTLLPLPVDLDRVEDAVDALGYQFLAADDRLIMPWPNHRVAVYFGRESGLHLTLLTRMRMTLDLSMINEVAQAITAWNAERIGPAAMLNVGDLGDLEIQFRSSLCVDEGVSTDQLLQFIQLTINTVGMAVDNVLELFTDLDIEGAGSEELRTEQDENDLIEDIRGLFVPPEVSTYDLHPDQESTGMGTPRDPSAGGNDNSGDDFTEDFTEDFDDGYAIWDSSAETPGGEADHTVVRETPDEPFLPIFSSFAETDDDGDEDDEEDQLDLLDFLKGDTASDIPAIAHDSIASQDNPIAASFPAADDPEYPREVTLDRVRDHLADIGVVKTSGEEDFLVAWINEVFLGFFIDNGPTFLVKGHWDPDMDPDRDFIKLFMMCNQWNERSLTTKAFCHKDPQGLQVRVEFAVPTAEGLTDSQLRHNIALSIHHILQAVDSLSIEATGTTIVDWPEPN